MRKTSVKMALSACFIVFPRGVISYPIYIFAALLLVDWRSKIQVHATFAIVSGYLISSFALAASANVSVTAFLLEFCLLLPMILFLSGYGSVLTQEQSLYLLRRINLILMVASVLHLATLGFPLRLPYVHYFPDEFYGTYGIGGARTLTIFGFFLLLMELHSGKGRVQYYWLAVGLVNFVIPSYILGIFSGCAALSIRYVKRPFVWVLGALILYPVVEYIFYRISNMNSIFIDDFGVHPKIYGFILIGDLYSTYWNTFIFGTSIGQLTSTAASWSSEYLREISGNSVPSLPGLFMSEYHKNIYGEVLSYANNNWNAISSAFNKPYSSVTTLLGELGVVGSLGYLYLLYKRLVKKGRDISFSRSLAVFCLVLYFLDVWHDNLWLGYCFLMSVPFLEPKVVKR